jgi:TolB-like protein/Tfp pilus assembly protein PilF
VSQVFISYNREDQPVARIFAEAFERAGLRVWWDTAIRSGETYDVITENALRSALAVVVLWSPRSVVSRWVRSEATLADRNKTLIPAMIEPCERPIMFELTQTAELGHWRGDNADLVWQAFLADVHRFVARETEAPAPAQAVPLAALPRPLARAKQGEAPSLAVLPFANRSGQADDDVFAVGMVEDIIDALSQGVDLRVVTSSATARFRNGAIPDLPAMARELGVRYVMEGNVRRAGQDLRVTAQLVEAGGGEILWTQRFERPLSELADLQEELVLDVAAHLHSQVARVEMARVLRKPHDLTAWECVTRSTAAYRSINGETLLAALQEARQAVEIAPNYGLAHATLADAAATIYMWLQPDDPARIKEIRGFIEKALALEPENAIVLAHVSEAYNYIGRPDEAAAPAERARKLSPSCGLAHYSSAVSATLLGNIEQANRHFDTELRVAPGSHTLFASYTWRGSGFLRTREWDRADHAYAEATRLNPTQAAACIGQALSLGHQGLTGDAVERAAKVRALEPQTPLESWERCMKRWFINCPHEPDMTLMLRELWQQAPAPA